MTTNARLGFGTLFKILTSTGPDVYTTIGEQIKLKPAGLKVDTVDVSHEESPSAAREFIAGLVDYGELSIDLNWVPGGSAQSTLLGYLRQVVTCRVVYPDGSYDGFDAILTGIAPDAPLDKQLTASISLKVTGVVTPAAAAAPTNSVLPSMSGALTVGTTLTAFVGVWAHEPTSFAYQWKKDGTNISAATARTYVPVSGDATHALSVVVTATNSAGSASATSAASAAVV